MSSQPPARPPDWQPPPQQPTQPLPGWGQQPPQQGQPPQWGPPGQQPQPGWVPPRQQPRRRSRVFMWVILAINALFLVAVISTFNIESSCVGKVGDELSACQAGEGIGKGLVFFALLFVWALVDIILLVIFMVTRRQLR
jgi:hypothetical protein